MTTTVTTATVSTVTMMGFGVALGAMLTVALIAMLVGRELASASDSPRGARLARVLTVGMAPLMASFALILAVKIAEII